MKTTSIAFVKAIVLSLCLILPSGFLAMAAESELVPKSSPEKPEELPPSLPDTSGTTENQPKIQGDFKGGNLVDDEKRDMSKILEGDVSPDGERPEDDQIPVGIKINGMLLDTDMTVYLPSGYSQDEILVPLGTLTELLSFAITSNAGDKKAEGFFIKEENTFQLDLNSQEVLVAGKKRPLKKGEVEIQQGQIYVKSSSLQEWFDLKIRLEMSDLVLEVTSDDVLPFQERLKRIANAKKKERTFKFDAIKPENATLAPYKTFSYPSLYITSSVGAVKSQSGSTNLRGRATVQGNQDLAKFEANYILSGLYDSVDSTRDLNAARFTMQRRDLNKNLLGPLHAGRIAFGDISFPSVPLFVGGQRGAGFQASSDPRLGARYANNTENFIIDGDAPVGYDAELYRNGAFVAYQQIGADGRYNFENVDLTTGYNNFEIILYGPQGQKTVVKRDIVRGSRMLKKGEMQYDFAAGTPMGELLPVSKINTRDDRTPGFSGQTFYGVNQFLTVGASAYSGPQVASRTSENSFIDDELDDEDDEEDTVRSTGAAVSAVTSFLGMNVQGQLLGADKGRRAYEAAVNARPFGLNVGASHTEYKNFLADDQDIKSRTELSLYKNFGKFNTRFQIQKREFLDRENETIYEHVLAFKLFSINFNNDLIKTVSESGNYDNFEGRLTAAASMYGIRFRSSLIYDLEPEENSRYRRFSFSGQKNLGNRTSLRAEGIHDFDAKNDQLNLTLSKDYDKFGLDFDATATTDNNYSFTVGMRMALQPDQNDRYILVDPKTGGQAALGARAFIDNNNNGIYDIDVDKLLEGIGFKASSSSSEAESGVDGIAYLTNLSESPLRLSVQTESIPDIYLAPKFNYRDLIPRRGSTPVIDFPFVKMGEIAGYLTHLKQGVEGVIVKLLSITDGTTVEETETDSDGYFIFPAIKGGNYKISFGTKEKSDFQFLDFNLDANIEDQPELKVEASDELAKAAEEANDIRTSAGSSAADRNRARMNAPAGEMPNIDDPLNEEDLKPLDEKGVESIITQ